MILIGWRTSVNDACAADFSRAVVVRLIVKKQWKEGRKQPQYTGFNSIVSNKFLT
jgi:hypothetical protein